MKTKEVRELPPTIDMFTEQHVNLKQEQIERNSQLITSTPLPYQLKVLVDVLGVSQSVSLLEEWGGQKVYISAETTLLDLSADDMKKLVKEFGNGWGCWVNLPKVDKLKQIVRNQNIHTDRSSGLTIRALAKKYRLTEQTVRVILKGR